MKIFKYVLEVAEQQTVQLPRGAGVLSTAFQGHNLCIWALVDPSVPTEPRTFIIHGTGHPADDLADAVFIGTAFTGPLVFHVFELPARSDA